MEIVEFTEITIEILTLELECSETYKQGPKHHQRGLEGSSQCP